nr:transglycosylase SLT domain-containing protein [Aliiruegeria haliotis]
MYRRSMQRCVAALAVVAFSCAAQAQEAKTVSAKSKDFTFKRVKVGGGGAGKRILVQIDPAEQKRLLAVNPAVPAPFPDGVKPVTAQPDGSIRPDGGDGATKKVASAAYDWYWDLMSPELAKSRSGRMESAINALHNGPDGRTVKAPRLSTMQDIADRYGAEILKATIGTRVSPALVLAVISIESAGKRQAVSHAGATGLMQLMPATAERFGVKDSTIASENIKGGVAYLDWLLNRFGRDPLMALAGYNAGEGAVEKNGGIPPYAETRDYVPKVIAAWSVARGLCLTQPQLVSDGCVFRTSVRATASASD